MGIIHARFNAGSHPSWTELHEAVFKNVHVEEIKSLFSTTKILVLEHSEEILDVKVTDSKDPSWKKQKISHPQVIKWTRAKVHVHSDSVLRLGELSALPDAAERWKGQLVDFQTTVSYQVLRNRRRTK